MVCIIKPPMRGSSIQFIRERPGLEMSHVSRSTHVFPLHFHDDLYAIGLMRQGASHCLGQKHDRDTVRQGQACLINPGQVHSGVPVESAISYTMLYLHVDLVRSLAEDVSQTPGCCPEFTDLICAHPGLVSSLHHLAGVLHGPESLATDTTLIRTLGDLLQIHGGLRPPRGGKDPRFVNQAKEVLRANLDSKLVLKDMAAALGVSQYYFVRLFKRLTGVPPHVYRTQRRVELARTLIRRSLPLSDIAQTAGFTDQSHLTNTFKLYTGTTPGQYARLLKLQHPEIP